MEVLRLVLCAIVFIISFLDGYKREMKKKEKGDEK